VGAAVAGQVGAIAITPTDARIGHLKLRFPQAGLALTGLAEKRSKARGPCTQGDRRSQRSQARNYTLIWLRPLAEQHPQRQRRSGTPKESMP